MKLPQYVSAGDRTVSVVGMVDKANTGKEKGIFVDQKGYIDEDQNIWIYSGSGKPKNSNEYPYFWLNEDGEKVFSDPPKLIRDAFNTSHMIDMGLVTIVNKTKPNEQLYDEQEIEDINAASNFYVPIIKEDDDFLKKIVKTTIIEKGIDINRLKGKMSEKYVLPNMKAALNNKTKMSVIYFCCWMNLLGCDFEVTVLNNDESMKDQLDNPLVYQSNKDRLSEISKDGQLKDLNTGKYLTEEDDE